MWRNGTGAQSFIIFRFIVDSCWVTTNRILATRALLSFGGALLASREKPSSRFPETFRPSACTRSPTSSSYNASSPSSNTRVPWKRRYNRGERFPSLRFPGNFLPLLYLQTWAISLLLSSTSSSFISGAVFHIYFLGFSRKLVPLRRLSLEDHSSRSTTSKPLRCFPFPHFSYLFFSFSTFAQSFRYSPRAKAY